MANPSITFNIGEGGLGQPADGNDHISGAVFYGSTLPSGFTSGDRIKKVFSLEEAEALGIDGDYSDGTAATGAGFTVTAVGADGDTIQVKVAEVYSTIDLGTYIKVAADTTVSQVGDGIALVINAGTTEHGYSAVNTTGAIVVTAPKRMGAYQNSASVTTVITGTATVGTVTNFSGGAGSIFAVWHYHVSEFFRVNPQGVLYIGVYAVDTDYSPIKDVQDFAEGQIRQLLLYDGTTAFSTSHVTAMNTVCDTLYSENQPLVVIYNPNINGTATLAGLPNLNGLDSEMVSVSIGQDLTGVGNFLYKTVATSIGCGGTVLGSESKSLVSENIAWTGQNNIVNGDEYNKLGFSNGVTYLATPASALNTLTTYKYIYCTKYGADYPGSFFNNDLTCIASTSDFARIRNNRTMQKAVRNVRTALLPFLASPIEVQSDGTLTQDVIQRFKALCESTLDQMRSASEISQRAVTIDPTQDILSTNTLTIGVKIIPIGSAEQIVVNIGFATTI